MTPILWSHSADSYATKGSDRLCDGRWSRISGTRKVESEAHDGHFTIQHRDIVSSQGSAGNVIAALASFFVPGLGQLLQGRLLMAITQFVLAAALWFVLLGWAIHLWSVLDAAMWKPKS